MKSSSGSRSTVVVASVAAVLCIGACSDGGDQEAAAIADSSQSSTTTAAAVATSEPDSTDDSLADPSASEFYCGEFGVEQVPTLMAIDVETGAPTWKMCSDSVVPLQMVGRADGATILWEQDGHGGSQLVGVDDAGVERWRRPTRTNGPGNMQVRGDTAVVVTDEVEGIEAATGDVRWSHPVADGTPVGATDDLVVEISGGPYALSTDVATGPRASMMRAIDSSTGEQRWTREVDLVSFPGGGQNQYSPTVGDEVIVIPDIDGSSSIVDIANGADLRSEVGLVEADGALLISRDAMFRPAVLIDPRSGTRVDLPDGQPVYAGVFRGQLPGAAGMLLTSDPPTGPAATLRLIDTSTGELRWEVPYVPVIGGSDDQVFVADGPVLQVLDASDGTLATEFRAPTDLATFTSAVGGDGVVIVAPQWRGSPNGSPTEPGPGTSTPPNCDGGQEIFDEDIDGTPVVLTESEDGSVFCVGDGVIDTIGFVPNTPTPDPRYESVATSESHIFHIFGLPAGFDAPAAVVDENGVVLPTARGVASDYLVVIEPFAGRSGGEPPPMIPRTFELRDPQGAVVARVPFLGFSTEGAAEPAATFEDVVACMGEYGIQMPPPSNGGAPATVAVASSADDLQAAWASCREVFASTISTPGQGSPEFAENQMSQLDCLAAAGFYPIFAQPVSDEAALREAYDTCDESTPGRIALVECLNANGLAVSVDGETSGGPHAPEQAAAAWAVCRDVFITGFLPNSMAVDQVVGSLDCAADKGWIPAVMDSDERSSGQASADIATCRASN